MNLETAKNITIGLLVLFAISATVAFFVWLSFQTNGIAMLIGLGLVLVGLTYKIGESTRS